MGPDHLMRFRESKIVSTFRTLGWVFYLVFWRGYPNPAGRFAEGVKCGAQHLLTEVVLEVEHGFLWGRRKTYIVSPGIDHSQVNVSTCTHALWKFTS